MKKIFLAFLLCAGFALSAFGQSSAPLTVTEIDGSPRVTGVTTLVFSNGTVTCTGKSCTVVTGGGGGGGSPGGSNTQVQYNAAGSFAGAAGFTFNGTSTVTLGVAGTSVGTLALKNATSGTITLTPATGALGTTSIVFPATSGTVTVLGNTTTGSGSIVLAGSPTLTTPNLGTPSAATLTNATGLPVSTGISGLGTGVATFLATPTSANLASAVTDETGSGSLVFGTSPTLTTPAIADFTSATHNHQGASGGGQLNATSVFSAGTVPVARLPVMVGDSGSGGTAGLVPAPAAGDATKQKTATAGSRRRARRV